MRKGIRQALWIPLNLPSLLITIRLMVSQSENILCYAMYWRERPPLLHYTATWNVQTVLNYLEGLGASASLSLKFLTFKLAMLLALTRPSCSADLAALQLDHQRFSPESVVSHQGFIFPFLPQYSELCPVQTLKQYEALITPLKSHETTKLFISLVKSHKSVTWATVDHWLREVLRLAGINVNVFSGHSVWGASASAAAGAEITTNEGVDNKPSLDINCWLLFWQSHNWKSTQKHGKCYHHAHRLLQTVHTHIMLNNVQESAQQKKDSLEGNGVHLEENGKPQKKMKLGMCNHVFWSSDCCRLARRREKYRDDRDTMTAEQQQAELQQRRDC